MRASTSVAVELSWNESEAPKEAYRAEVEFCTAEEWATEFDIIRNDIQSRPEGEKLAAGFISDSGVGVAKLKAVYPGTQITELLEMTKEDTLVDEHLSNILGKTKSISNASSKEFHKNINKFIDSSNKSAKAAKIEYWPLVKLVRIYVKAEILRHGLVLVDLPGLGDSNSGRTRVAEKYVASLKYMWVVADINRAVDEGIAHQLLGDSFKRQLHLRGRYHDNFVTFIMTRTTIVNTDEVIGNMEQSSDSLNKCLEEDERLKDTRDEAQARLDEIHETEGSHGRKRRFEDVGADDACKAQQGMSQG